MRKRNNFWMVVCLLSLPFISGCLPLIIGGAAGALGAYVVGRDTIQGETDVPYDEVWEAALAVSRFRGATTKEDSVSGVIELESGSSKIWIKIFALTQSTTRLKVSARKHHFPNLTLAQDTFVKIMDQTRGPGSRRK
ncbi:MAG: DUF3568 domain-containing protein [Candidatus Omnitrophica bacterium]|nr:DUF3568 domain-containing protein [Candidatus Omnitrophota bacterium]